MKSSIAIALGVLLLVTTTVLANTNGDVDGDWFDLMAEHHSQVHGDDLEQHHQGMHGDDWTEHFEECHRTMDG